MSFELVWVIGAGILLVVGYGAVGYVGDSIDEWIAIVSFGALLWPVWLSLAVIVGVLALPYYGGRALGARHRRRQQHRAWHAQMEQHRAEPPSNG